MKIKFEDLDTKEPLEEWTLIPSQEKFWDSPAKYVLFSGGYGCGKSFILTMKALDLALRYPKNYILMGRRTYPELRDTLQKEFFTLCPESFYKSYNKSEGRVIFKNNSEIIFRHLDTMAASEIRSLNLGAAFIDQAEDISKDVILGLMGRLRREGVADKDRRIYMSCNPALTWLYADFKQSPMEDSTLIEASTLENRKNLPESYVLGLLKYPESYKKQYVYGVWDEDLLSDSVVFAREHIEQLRKHVMEPVREKEGLKIYKEFKEGHRYQMGIDVAEGIETVAPDKDVKPDSSVIVIVDLDALEEVASWSGRIPPEFAAEKAARFARMYSSEEYKCMIVPEMNAVGLALLNKLAKEDDMLIYRREEHERSTGKTLQKLGWRTTRQTKPLLVSRFQEMLRLADPKVRTKETLEEFRTFVYSDLAKKQGMGAQEGFHDDRVIATLLAFWEKTPFTESSVITHIERSGESEHRFIQIRDGKAYISLPEEYNKPELEIVRSWQSD